ncbi:hypothetical protein G5714_001157 [Onychostoma macrolepis]|uniref:Uncharacterized protein n=1 Tax=Onychostoma macrolepis TaxID=369639 RepID=A0A7J6DIE5_9TELE|nr:hypothetical protein G5714_001157 [Onychostoma macrolepis]
MRNGGKRKNRSRESKPDSSNQAQGLESFCQRGHEGERRPAPLCLWSYDIRQGFSSPVYCMPGDETCSGGTREPQVMSELFLFPSRVLERRVRVAATNKGDPSFSPLTTVQTKQPPVPCSWGKFMDEVSSDLPPLFPILAEERE